MSHFFTIVLVPSDTPLNEIQSKVESLLAPYDENLEVEPYETKCSCINLIANIDSSKKATEEAGSIYNKPDPECEDCNGTGRQMTTYNPNSKWDWWRIGGRWDGWIVGQKRFSQNGFNFGEEHEQLRYNMAKVSDLPPDFTCFAIVTPDGVWHERGKMGWWGIVSNGKEQDTWNVEVKQILAQYSDCFAIGCDLHI